MKLLVVFSLIALASCMPRNEGRSSHGGHGDDDHYEAIPMSKLYNKANAAPGGSSSRRSGFGGGSSGSGGGEMCSLQCMRQMKTDIEGDQEFSAFIEKQSKPYRFDNQFDQRMLNKYCQKMNRTVDCVRPCQEGQVKQMANKALSLPKYMCVETRFTEYAPCYNKVGKQMEKICHAQNKCGAKKAALEADMRKQPTSMADIENMLKHTCDYMNCYNDCDRQKVIQECGADANRVLEGLYKKSIDVMKDIFTTMGININIPAQCNRVGAGGSGGDSGTDHDTDTEDDDDDNDQDGGQPQTTRGQSGRGGQGGRGTGDRRGTGTGGQGGRRGGQGGQGQGGRGTQTGTTRGGSSSRRGTDQDEDDSDNNN